MPGSGRELEDRQAPFLQLRAEGADRLLGHRYRLEPEVCVNIELGYKAVEALAVGGADIDGDAHPPWDHVHGSRLDVDLADGGHRAVDGARGVSHAEDVFGRRRQRVETARHRNGAGVAGLSYEGALAANDADDPHRQAQRDARSLQNRPLLDVHLEEACGQSPALDEGRAADAAALLVPEDHDGTLVHALDRLDRGDHPERTVELAPVRHRVEVRAGPDARLPGATDEVPGFIHLDVEPGVSHPPCGQLVRAILPLGAGDTVRADEAADGVELV